MDSQVHATRSEFRRRQRALRRSQSPVMCAFRGYVMVHLVLVVVSGLLVRSGRLSIRGLMPYLTVAGLAFLVAPFAAGWLIPWIGVRRSGLRCPQCQRRWMSPGGIDLPLRSECGRCGYPLVQPIAEQGAAAEAKPD